MECDESFYWFSELLVTFRRLIVIWTSFLVTNRSDRELRRIHRAVSETNLWSLCRCQHQIESSSRGSIREFQALQFDRRFLETRWRNRRRTTRRRWSDVGLCRSRRTMDRRSRPESWDQLKETQEIKFFIPDKHQFSLHEHKSSIPCWTSERVWS